MIIKELKILRQHGIQYVPDLKTAVLTPLFRGRPVIKEDPTDQETEKIKKLCPSNAITTEDGFGIDIGKCVFCKECALAYPDKIAFTNDYKIASNDKNNLIVRKGDSEIKFNENIVRPEVRKLFKNALKLRQVSAGGDNSCEFELYAAGNVNFDMGRYGIEFVASPRHADGIVITGPITENMSEALQICWDASPGPKVLILVGTDAISGGMFADSHAVNRKFLEKYPVDLYVPGNPAHPLTFINGVLRLIGK
ncbi:MAG TPA: NADH:ubiquinone oxidoreductase [Clostridiales bacterium]|nr:NADH:ubiquinone oxidoreductase [Clostridiales bacterium]HQP70617.1 NADH:ubiquinone oxidoreductase [Clostridiales bacterium]